MVIKLCFFLVFIGQALKGNEDKWIEVVTASGGQNYIYTCVNRWGLRVIYAGKLSFAETHTLEYYSIWYCLRNKPQFTDLSCTTLVKSLIVCKLTYLVLEIGV